MARRRCICHMMSVCALPVSQLNLYCTLKYWFVFFFCFFGRVGKQTCCTCDTKSCRRTTRKFHQRNLSIKYKNRFNATVRKLRYASDWCFQWAFPKYMETPIEPNRTVSQRSELNRTVPNRTVRANVQGENENTNWKWKWWKVRVCIVCCVVSAALAVLELHSVSALSSGSRATN